MAPVPTARAARRRLPLPELAALLTEHPEAVEAFERRVWTAAGPRAHWFWLGAISDSGHGKLQIGSRSDGSAIVALTHRIAWVLSGGDCGSDAVIRHDCDESSCLNPADLRRGSMADNSADWVSRRHRMEGPLGDVRGLAGRARAIRAALLAAHPDDPDAQAAAAVRAAAAGQPLGGQLALIVELPTTPPPIRDGIVPVWRAATAVGADQPPLWGP
jgi:hypothetical protein